MEMGKVVLPNYQNKNWERKWGSKNNQGVGN